MAAIADGSLLDCKGSAVWLLTLERTADKNPPVDRVRSEEAARLQHTLQVQRTGTPKPLAGIL